MCRVKRFGVLVCHRRFGKTVLGVEHKPVTIAIADHFVDLWPGAVSGGGTVCFEGTYRTAPSSVAMKRTV